MNTRGAVLLILASIVAGCRTTVRRNLAIPANSGPRTAAPAREWEVRSDGKLVGLVVYFEANGPVQDSVYMVRNAWHQDLGMIDWYGRAYRYLPHLEEPSWVGSGTVKQGVERILERPDCRLAEVPLPTTPVAGTDAAAERSAMVAPNSLPPGS